jgi:hypothetical protein
MKFESDIISHIGRSLPETASSFRQAAVLICGIPASGKSTYGRWLEREKGVLFADAEEDGALEAVQLSEIWDDLFTDTAGAGYFVEAVKAREQAIVLAWGFPIEYLPIVSALKDAGMEVWWFDGDREAARHSFELRGTIALQLFERQIAEIEANWPEIESLFTEHIIQVVGPGPTYLLPAEIYLRMFGEAVVTSEPESSGTVNA